MRRWWWICVVVAGLVPGVSASAAETRSVAGLWRVKLDPGRVGEAEHWYERDIGGAITLPGSTDEAKLGTPSQVKPSLDGLYRLYPYEGPAWFQYEVIVPGSWKGKRVSLMLERVHWETKVWVDGKELPGTQDSLVAPHVHAFGDLSKPTTRRITIRVDNTKKIDLGGFVSILYEGTQTNWNGLVGAMELRAVDPVAVDDVQVYPDVTRRTARVKVRLSNTTGKPVTGKLTLSAKARNGRTAVATDQSDVTVDRQAEVVRELAMGPDVKLWDEFTPNLYVLNAAIAAQADGKSYLDEKAMRFGMRSFAAEGTRFTLNGRPIFLRGTLECAIFPRTGYPPTDVGEWRRIFRVIKAHGLNFMRFHSWCPPEAAFAAADLEGVIVQPEGPQANIDAGTDPKRDAFIEAEFLRIIRTYGNHPSFCLMTLGNEYGGSDALLSKWIDMLRKEDPRHLYASPSSGQNTTNRQYTEGGPRGVGGPGTERDFRREVQQQDRPLTGHEIGQWTFFPNFDEIPKYNGVLAAKNFELVRSDLAAKHLFDLAPRFVQATGKHAVLLYKEEIEVLLRTPKYAGFSLLDLHDYPGQGTALIGLLDPFWDSKGFIAPEAHSRYCGPTVPLLRLPKRTYTADEPLVATAEVAHYGPLAIENARPVWTIKDEQGRTIASGALEVRTLPTGDLTQLGAIRAPLDKAPAPSKLTVSLALEGTAFVNAWDVWVYPPTAPVAPPPGAVVSRTWDDATKAALAAGKTVVLFPQFVNAKRSLPGRFLPVFWSPVWFPTQKPNTMGILCDPKHPLFAHFPTEFHSNWQWYELIERSRSLILDDTPSDLRPIVRVIDNFARNHKLGNVVEARVGPGRLLACTIDLPGLAGKTPAARQLQRCLYEYVGSDAFRPASVIDLSTLDALLLPSAGPVMQRLGARIIRADSQQEGFEAANILDDDPATMWHTPWGEQEVPFPHEVVVGFDRPVRLSAVVCQPRQDQSNGWIKDYRIEVSTDGTTWTEAARGRFDHSDAEKTVTFKTPATARYLKLIALSPFDHQSFASLAELSVIEAKP
jgi:F5/8 type C domain/Glycosyl hydrolases family 2/Glycosyl hydrolases family 2, sugar binding domain